MAPRDQAVFKADDMTLPDNAPSPTVPRWAGLLEWLVVGGLALTLVWTTLCLGGYLAETMVGASWAVFGLTVLASVVWTVRSGQQGMKLNLIVLIPLPFLLYALASVFWLAPAKWLAWREWLLWLQMWLVFALVLHFGRSRAQTWTLVGTLAALGVAGAGMAAYQRFVDPSWMMLGRVQADQFVGRSAGMFGIPNSLAGLLELMAPVCLVLLSSRAVRPAAKIVCAWLAVLFLFAVVLTGSRGGWIGLGLALLAWPLMTGGDWRRRLLAAGVGLAVLLVGFALLYRFSDYARKRIEPFLDGRFEASRPLIWKAGWQMWQDAPWLGRGAASYNVLFEQYRPRGFLNEPDWTHNDYLNTLSDYGLVGFGLWAGAGGAVLWLGWTGVRRARRETRRSGDILQHWRWRFGLLLGLVAFALHLGADFHTKIPALAFAAAVAAALVVRDEGGWLRPIGRGLAWGAAGVLVVGVMLLAWKIATPLYCAEALRFEARRAIDRYASTGEGELRAVVPRAKADFVRAVRIDPRNGQAWADLAYATVQTWHASGGDLVTLGRFAELAADEALQRCPILAEFWVRKAVALDVQRGRPETESCYRRALELAPHSAGWWLYYAHHLQAFPNRKRDALVAVETCLTLDRGYPGGEALREQLLSRR